MFQDVDEASVSLESPSKPPCTPLLIRTSDGKRVMETLASVYIATITIPTLLNHVELEERHG